MKVQVRSSQVSFNMLNLMSLLNRFPTGFSQACLGQEGFVIINIIIIITVVPAWLSVPQVRPYLQTLYPLGISPFETHPFISRCFASHKLKESQTLFLSLLH